MRVASTMAIVLVAGVLNAPPARAACAGFTDVDVGGFVSGFCPNVTWIKNRAITVGCSSATLYCPGEPVARLSMALFMRRLGDVLSPQAIAVDDAGGALDLSDPNAQSSYLCQSPEIAPATYPRTTHIDAVLSFDSDAPVTLQLTIGSAANGGSFNFISGPFALVDAPGDSRRNLSTSWISVAVPGQPGQKYAVRAVRVGGSGHLASWTCSLQVRLISGVQP
jgi:hypothetical protein